MKDLETARLVVKDLEEVDRELAVLARSAGAFLVVLAEALIRIREGRYTTFYGYSSLGAYVRQRLQRGERWGRDLALLGLRLRQLPLLREALRAGRVSLSAAILLSRNLDPRHEAEQLAAHGGKTVRALRQTLAEERVRERVEDEELHAVTFMVDDVDGIILEASRMRVDRVAEMRVDDPTFMMAFVAEVENAMAPLPVELTGFDEERQELIEAVRDYNREQRHAAEEAAEPRLPPPVAVEPPEVGELPDDPHELDFCVAGLGAQLAGLDLEVGRRAEVIMKNDGWRRLRFASPQQYAEERCGVSLRTLSDRRYVARHASQKPEIGAAIQQRRIGFLGARFVAAMSPTGELAKAWLERAEKRTMKHLMEEVRAARILGIDHPPDAEELELVFDLQRDVEGLVDPESARQLSAAPTGVKRRVTLRGDSFFRDRIYALQRRYEELGAPYGSFIHFGALCILTANVPEGLEGKWSGIFLRDRLTCACPVCSRRDVNVEHIEPKSQGGSDESTNTTSDCGPCGLDLITPGFNTVSGTAPNHLVWRLGIMGERLIIRGRDIVRD